MPWSGRADTARDNSNDSEEDYIKESDIDVVEKWQESFYVIKELHCKSAGYFYDSSS